MNPHLEAVLCIVITVAIGVGYAMTYRKVLLPRIRKKIAAARTRTVAESPKPNGLL
ncbi:MAG: hypothetical protein LBR80_06115 [Deltaproteobacteria bacterium]|jgi:hypothetical protein|nr:hypothetical protein [Deltaproteobacteria bacterium]